MQRRIDRICVLYFGTVQKTNCESQHQVQILDDGSYIFFHNILAVDVNFGQSENLYACNSIKIRRRHHFVKGAFDGASAGDWTKTSVREVDMFCTERWIKECFPGAVNEVLGERFT